MEEKIKHYSNGEITVVWEAAKCMHSGICAKTLPTVFKPKEKPWIRTGGASSAEIVNTVAKCPSGALSILDK